MASGSPRGNWERKGRKWSEKGREGKEKRKGTEGKEKRKERERKEREGKGRQKKDREGKEREGKGRRQITELLKQLYIFSMHIFFLIISLYIICLHGKVVIAPLWLWKSELFGILFLTWKCRICCPIYECHIWWVVFMKIHNWLCQLRQEGIKHSVELQEKIFIHANEVYIHIGAPWMWLYTQFYNFKCSGSTWFD